MSTGTLVDFLNRGNSNAVPLVSPLASQIAFNYTCQVRLTFFGLLVARSWFVKVLLESCSIDKTDSLFSCSHFCSLGAEFLIASLPCWRLLFFMPLLFAMTLSSHQIPEDSSNLIGESQIIAFCHVFFPSFAIWIAPT